MVRTRAAIGERGVVVLGEDRALLLDGLLGPEVAMAVREEALAALAAGDLRPAGIGREAARVEAIRGDFITWLDPSALVDHPALGSVAQLFASVMETLAELAWLGARELEMQLAVYPAGGGYQRHRDNPHGRSRRRMTVIYYANDWRPGDGGELEIREPDGARLIEPIADRLVLFRPHLEHAVRPVLAGPRVAISGWLAAPEPC